MHLNLCELEGSFFTEHEEGVNPEPVDYTAHLQPEQVAQEANRIMMVGVEHDALALSFAEYA
jgi:hypothetical protein